jgi:hypothetical protein
MNRHIVDRPKAEKGKTFLRYAKLDALMRAAPRKQAEVLRRMPRRDDGGARLRRFLWLDRQA